MDEIREEEERQKKIQRIKTHINYNKYRCTTNSSAQQYTHSIQAVQAW